MKLISTVNVLGAEYKVVESDEGEDEALRGIDGYCDPTIHKCVINSFEPDERRSFEDLYIFRQRVTRHELIHAFLFESGLASDSWAPNEEIVDWVACQFPKMLKAFKQADAI